jgi:glycerol-3-phosphate dehydrogenase
MNSTFSTKQRGSLLEQMAAKELDLIVIGGGITGAGIAWDASSRGLDTGLLEMNDFASGTSSRSTKLVHGGLRYLKQGEFKLVRDIGRERAILHQNAPHIVIPAPMILPIYQGGTYGYLASSIGLYIYDLLAGVKRKERRKMLKKQETISLEPLLKRERLKGSGFYYEYQTDDARLTIEIIKTAYANGAKIANYAKVTSLLYRNESVVGVKVEDLLTKRVYDIYAKKVVNATGPWVDKVRQQDGSLQGKRLLLTKGVHIVVDGARLPIKQSAYLDTPDGRMIFVIPRGTKTYIGTTDTIYTGDIQEPRTTIEDRDYLLNAVNHSFPSVDLRAVDIESNWAGLRPLIFEESKGPSELSRKDEIFLSPSGLVTIAGGKLTGFRKMAENVVDLIVKQLGKRNLGTKAKAYARCSTDRQKISGGEGNGNRSYEENAKELHLKGAEIGISRTMIDSLLAIYGSNVKHIYTIYREIQTELPLLNIENLVLQSELIYSMDYEMTVSALDFLMRRTGMVYFDRPRAEEIANEVLQKMSEWLQWDEAEFSRQQTQLERELKAAVYYEATT